MSEKVIIVKECQRVKKGDKEWVELVDQEDKKNLIFKSLQSNDGEWIHFKLDDFENCENKTIKLTKEKKGEFWNVIKAEFVIAESLPLKPSQISGEEIGMWWKELGEDLRSGHIDRNSSVGKALRLTYFAQMFKVLNIDLKELQAGEAKEAKTSKPATTGTQPKVKGVGTVPIDEQGEGEV